MSRRSQRCGLRERGLTSLTGLALCWTALFGLASSAGALTIQLGFDPSVSPAEQAVVQEAAARWESVVVSRGTLNVNVSNASLAPSLLGLASNYTSTGGVSPAGRQLGTPTGGQITFNSNVAFFVDPTPGSDSEYIPTPGLPTYMTADPADPVVLGSYDLLTTAIHEIGHVLGISSGFESFASQIVLSQTQAHYAYVFGSAPTLGDAVNDYRAGFFSHGSALLPLSESTPEEGGSVGGLPSHLDPALTTLDTSGGLFPFDVLTPGLGLGERRLITNVDLDMLADAYGYSVVPEPGTALLLGLGLVALTSRRLAPGPG